MKAGMISRKDTTVVVDERAAVVTNIYNEHTEIIGPTREGAA